MNRPTDEQLSRLPKYAQAYIKKLERERAKAVETMRKMESDQLPSKVWSRDFVSIGEGKGPSEVKRYFHCERLEIESAGVRLCVDGLWGDKEIQLSWRPAGPGFPMGDVLFVPTSYQQARLVSLENAR